MIQAFKSSTAMKKSLALFSAFIVLLSASPLVINAQSEINSKSQRITLHNEVQDDAYVAMPSSLKKTSPAYKSRSSVFFTIQANVDENGNNILNDAANEPSIAVDPLNPDRMAIGWRQFDNVGNNFRQAGVAFTTDGGESWTFPGVIDQGVFRSDPVLDADNQGNFYYNSLTSSNGEYFCRVFRSDDGGNSWDGGVPAQGGDKQWMEIDKTGGPGEGNIYSFWTSYYSYCYPGNFTRSTDGGDYYEDCVSVDGNPYWGTLAIGPESELYIVGTGYNDGLVVVKSMNAHDPDAFVAWDYYTYVDMDGQMASGPDVNPGGLLGQASIAVNPADGPGKGDVYVLVSVERLTNNDPGDVMFAKSIDGGLTFSDPVRINDDLSASNTQWFGTMSVAPNGRIDVVWLDTRDAPAFSPLLSSLYYSFSLDGGETWSENERLSDSFDPHLGWPNQQKMGDYFDMYSDNSSAHLAWANTLNSEQDVYYGRITPVITGVSDNTDNDLLLNLSAYPNPFSLNSRIVYKLQKASQVNIELYDMVGKRLALLQNGFQTAGSYSVSVDAGLLAKGVYFCKVKAGNETHTIRLIKVD